MQSTQELEPIVHIRELKKDRVNFTLENVDLAYAHNSSLLNAPADTRDADLRTRSVVS